MATGPPPSSSSSNSSTSALPPTDSQPKVSDTPPPSTHSNSSAPPPHSPPPAVATSPPPSLPLSPPPAATPLPTPPPQSPPHSPPPSPPPSPPAGSPPVASSPPPPLSSPQPPTQVSPPKSSPPPPTAASPPTSPPTKALSPPPANSPPPPLAKPPQNSPPPPPSDSPPALQPPKSSPSPPDFSSPPPPPPPPPPPVPSSTSQTPISPPAAPRNSSVNGTAPISPLPPFPPEKPTAKSTPFSSSDGAIVGQKDSSGGKLSGSGAAIGIVVGVIALGLVVTAVWFMVKRKRRGAGLVGGYGITSPFSSSPSSGSLFLRPQNSPHLAGSASGSTFVNSPDPGSLGNSRPWFTYEELAQATNGFSAQNLLGEGGFGCVYKGFLMDGREVAVKQLKIGGGQGEREFRAEVEIISRVHHRHLVTLVGYCISENQRLLVYEYVPNNTLHYHLHGQGMPPMEWATRVKVAAGAARGIAYLHEDCHPRIIHRDIKSTNILIDNTFEARVADFGLAKLALDANTHVTTRVMGTFGYMAPEYASSGKLTEKSDVFSFGVVLLELITGRKPVDSSQPLGDESLVEWARPLLTQALESESFEELIDPRLEKNYLEPEMFRMIEAAAVCIRHLASKRPRMSQVVRALDSIGELSDLTNGMKPGQSEIFNSREQSAQIRMFKRMAFGSQDCSSEFFDRSQGSWKSSWASRD